MARYIRNGYEVVKKWDDWALLDRRSAGWVVAHYPQYDTDGNITSWGHGHYFTDFFDAVNYVEGEINNKIVVSLTPAQKQALIACISYDFDESIKFINEYSELPDEHMSVDNLAKQLVSVLKSLGEPDKAREFDEKLDAALATVKDSTVDEECDI